MLSEGESEEEDEVRSQLCFATGKRPRKKGSSSPRVAVVTEGNASPPGIATRWKCFTYNEIALATNSFHSNNLVGSGGYGRVYKGTLASGVHIAVKVLKRDEKESDFLTEVGILGHISHPNTTRLLGFCIGQGRFLVFECSLHGSLAIYLHGSTRTLLDWPQRYKIARGAAQGLNYLHKECQRRIIHRDIKSSNILLGADFEPQISDFGLARWLPHQWTHHTIKPVEGTPGYLAPEYIMHGIVDEKTDVYAFGVLLLELITGCKPVEGQGNLVDKVVPMLESGNVDEVADKRLSGSFNAREMQRMGIVATQCVRSSAISRPSMQQVTTRVVSGLNAANATGFGAADGGLRSLDLSCK